MHGAHCPTDTQSVFVFVVVTGRQLSRRYAHPRVRAASQSLLVRFSVTGEANQSDTRTPRRTSQTSPLCHTLLGRRYTTRVSCGTTNTITVAKAQRTDGGCNNKLVLSSGPTVQSSVVRARGKILSAAPVRDSKKEIPSHTFTPPRFQRRPSRNIRVPFPPLSGRSGSVFFGDAVRDSA